jgi:hypothetical protein
MFLPIPYCLSDHWCCGRSHRRQQTLDVLGRCIVSATGDCWTWITIFLLDVYALVSKQVVLYTRAFYLIRLPCLHDSWLFFFLLKNTRFILILSGVWMSARDKLIALLGRP